MTHTAARPAGAAASGGAATRSPAPSTPPGHPDVGKRRGQLRASLSRTPGKLRLLAVIGVIASIGFGLLGFQVAQLQGSALQSAQADTTQLRGVQDVRNALVAADASATNAFLIGGLEPAALRSAYEKSIAAASGSLTRLSGANAADAELLGKVNTSLSSYTGLIEQARANNRQGFPVGSGYLEAASSQLRSNILPDLDQAIDNAANRAAGDFNTAGGVLWLLALGLIALAALVFGQIWLAKRTHRVFNKQLLTASVLLLVVGLGALAFQMKAASDAKDVRHGSYAASLAVSQAYSEANDAKSMESFTLIKRGSGQAYEEQFQQLVEQAGIRLADAYGDGVLASGEIGRRLDAWSTRHTEIRRLDDDGSWDAAVTAATKTGEGTANAAFDEFTEAAEQTMAESAETTDAELSSARGTALAAGWILLATGIAAAFLAWRGVSVRLKEYR